MECGGVHSTGVGILFGERDFVVEAEHTVMQGRVVAMDISYRGLRFRVVGVYGPQGGAGRREMMMLLAPFLLTNRQLIVGGISMWCWREGENPALSMCAGFWGGLGW